MIFLAASFWEYVKMWLAEYTAYLILIGVAMVVACIFVVCHRIYSWFKKPTHPQMPPPSKDS